MRMIRRLFCAAALLAGSVAPASAGFSDCRFNFGMAWNGAGVNYPAEVDYVTIWAGSDATFNNYWHGDMLRATLSGGKAAGKTPVFYSYIIAFSARRDLGLADCDVAGSGASLCTQGANYIRQNRAKILSIYADYASKAAAIIGSAPMIWLMEPDFYQYASGNQAGGPLSFAEAGSMMNDLVATIKRYQPNAIVSMDISPWIPNPSGWYASMPMSQAKYINTSGGRTDANSTRIRNENTMTWAGIRQLTGKSIIADDGYGVGGSGTGHDATWDDINNLKARIADGVVGITQANPKADWGTTIASLRSQLPAIGTCGQQPVTYTLGVTTVGSGSVAKSPDQASYATGSTVQLAATPAPGYQFSGWSGSVTGTTNPTTVAMNGNKTVTATFVPVTQTTYTLAASATVGGTVTPTSGSYVSGTTVTLTATPAAGYRFSGWSGALTGTTNPASLVMNGNKTVVANFVPTTQSGYVLNVTVSGSGSVAKSPDLATYASGARVQLTATPAAGFQFTGWSGAVTGKKNPTSVTMSGNLNVTATFAPISGQTTYTLAASATVGGTVTPTSGSYVSGTTVVLVATPAAGYQFTGWSGALAGATNPASLVMNGNKTVVANFAPIASATEMIVNGGFAAGTQSWNIGFYGPTGTGSVVNGEYVVRANSAGSASWNVQLTQGALRLETGKTYTLAFRARAASPRSVNVNVGQAQSPYTSYIGGFDVQLGTTMAIFAKTFTMSATTDANARVEFNSGLSAIQWTLDDVSLKAVPSTGGSLQGLELAEPIALGIAQPGQVPSERGAVRLVLAEAGFASIEVFDLRGIPQGDLFSGLLGAGEHAFAAPGLRRGAYVVRIVAPGVRETRRLIVVGE